MNKRRFPLLVAFLLQPLFCGSSRSAMPEIGWPAFSDIYLASGGLETLPAPAVPVNSADDRLFPEDGSMPMAAWYMDVEHHPANAVKTALANEGVELKDVKFQYKWIQDIALFSRTGALVLQAGMPTEILQDLGLSMGVLGDDDRLIAVSEHTAADIGAASRRMKWTFLEGGGLITGSFPDGRPYAILTPSPIDGARKLYKYKTGLEIGVPQARRLVAEDLGVEPDNLFVVPATRHMDLFISPIRGGVLLLSDPSKTVGILKRLLAGNIPDKERTRLAGMLELYKNGFQPVYSMTAPPDIAGKPMGNRQFAYDKHEVAMLNAVEKALSGRFKVIRVAGIFNELTKYDGSEGSYIRDGIDFFNGFTGANRAGDLFQITNGGNGLFSLEDYWRSALAEQGVAPEHVYFPGSYGYGAGLDCNGAPSGK